MEFKKEIQESLKDYFKANFGVDIPNISISQINPDFRHLGDYAFNFNALRKIAKEHNADLKEIVLTVASTILAKQEGEAVESIRAQFAATDLDKGFINLKFSDQFWAKQLQSKIASGKVASIAPKAGKSSVGILRTKYQQTLAHWAFAKYDVRIFDERSVESRWLRCYESEYLQRSWDCDL